MTYWLLLQRITKFSCYDRYVSWCPPRGAELFASRIPITIYVHEAIFVTETTRSSFVYPSLASTVILNTLEFNLVGNHTLSPEIWKQ